MITFLQSLCLEVLLGSWVVRFLLPHHRVMILLSALLPRAFAARRSGLVGSSGLEPPTSRLSGARSNHLSYEPIQFCGVSRLSRLIVYGMFAVGGDDGIRTHDPLLAGQVLSQLSYTPLWK